MNRLELSTLAAKQASADALYKEFERRIAASPIGTCPVDLMLGCVTLSSAQTCGKCVPCRVGLQQLKHLLEDVMEGRGTMDTLDAIEKLAEDIENTADCAIGFSAASVVRRGLKNYRDDFESHVNDHECLGRTEASIPCMALCPARVDIPGYISLVNEHRYEDAVKLIRKDNPLPTTCAYICEHPCESHCRRNLLDDSINIRGLKKVAVDKAGAMEPPKNADSTGKTVAVLGGGPAGLTAAYYLSLMGHKVTIYEQRNKLGGMLRYGIPEYRFPKALLDKEIEFILSTGIDVKYNVSVGTDISYEDIKEQYDAVFVTVGAHIDRKLGIPGEEGEGVISAVELLRRIGDNDMPDFTGKRVVVVGGGNVAMDVTRTALRLGAKSVNCVYRRRKIDMTAQKEEIAGALDEEAVLLFLHAPSRIERDEEGKVTGLVCKPQIIGGYDAGGRPAPRDANQPERVVPADVIIVAIGQAIQSLPFEEGLPFRKGRIVTNGDTSISGHPGVFAGGDCVTGPTTVIRAIAAGKTAAANIDNYLGFNHEIGCDVEIPGPSVSDRPACGRVEIPLIEAWERKGNFKCLELSMTDEESDQESGRCLRCDYYGYGNFRRGRQEKW